MLLRSKALIVVFVLNLLLPSAWAASQRAAASANHSLVITPSGTVVAAGDNARGQLGRGPENALIDSNVPVQVAGLEEIVAVSAGNKHSMALDRMGRVWVWGDNTLRQLARRRLNDGAGIPAPVDYSPVPLQVVGIPVPTGSRICEISSRGDHCLVRDTLGNVYGWGSANGYSQLGTRTSATYIPERIPLVAVVQGVSRDLPAFAIAAGGNHSLALTEHGVFGWGNNGSGQAGNKGDPGIAAERLTPGLITPLPAGAGEIVSIAAGSSHSLAVTRNGHLLGWGDNYYYQLGDGTAIDRLDPIFIGTASTFASVSAGARHSAAISATRDYNVAYTWGNNAQGQLGHGTTTVAKVPTVIPYLPVGYVAVDVICGAFNTFFLHADAFGDPGEMRVKISGDLTYGQLGDGQTNATANRSSPVPGISPTFVSVAAGPAHTYAVGNDGLVWAWGDNLNGQLGIAPTTLSSRTEPKPIAGLTGIAAVSTCVTHSVALRQDGTVWCWGDNDYGQLGDNTQVDSFVPKKIASLSSIVAVASSNRCSMAIQSNGAVWYWGVPFPNQTPAKLPVQIVPPPAQGQPRFTSVAGLVLGATTFALVRSDGKVFLHGMSNGSLTATGGLYENVYLAEIPNLSEVTSVSLGVFYLAATRTDGRVVTNGQVCGSWTWVPTVESTISGAETIASGYDHILVSLVDGTVKAWGNNGDHQLGILNPSLFPFGDGRAYQKVPGLVSKLSDVRPNIERNPIAPQLLLNKPTRWKMLAGGRKHSIAVDVEGFIWTWGTNDRGQLGRITSGPVESLPVALQPFYPSGTSWDSDSDGLLDRWERKQFGDLTPNAEDDSDHDQLTNLQEFKAGTPPNSVVTGYSPPSSPGPVSHPKDADTDGIPDEVEIEENTKPDKADSDDDGLIDSEDAFPNENKLRFQRFMTPQFMIFDLGPGEATDVNDKGDAVGYTGNGTAFYWSKGSRTQLAGEESVAHAINNAGEIVGQAQFIEEGEEVTRAAYWVSSGSYPISLGALPADLDGDGTGDMSADRFSVATGITELGVPYGTSGEDTDQSDAKMVPTRFTVGGSPSMLGGLVSGNSEGGVAGVTKNGNAFGSVRPLGSMNASTPVVWFGASPEDAGFNISSATDARASDSLYTTYLVGNTNLEGATLKLKRRSGGYETFKFGSGSLKAINEDGLGIGEYAGPSLWQGGEFISLNSCLANTRGWTVLTANAINADGMIAGKAHYTPLDQNGQPTGPAEDRAILLLPIEFVTRDPDTGRIEQVNPLYAQSHPVPKVTLQVTNAVLDGSDLVVNLAGEFVDRLSEVIENRNDWVQTLDFVVNGKHIPEATIDNLPALAGNRVGMMPWQPYRSDVSFTKELRIPNIAVGNHTIRVVTGNNAVGNSGFAIVNVMITETELPGIPPQPPINISLSIPKPFAAADTNTLSVHPYVNGTYQTASALTESSYSAGRHRFSGNVTSGGQVYPFRFTVVNSPACLSYEVDTLQVIVEWEATPGVWSSAVSTFRESASASLFFNPGEYSGLTPAYQKKVSAVSYLGGNPSPAFTPIVLRFRGFGSSTAVEGSALPADVFSLKATAGVNATVYSKFKAFKYSPRQYYLVTTDSDSAPRIFVPMQKNLLSTTLKGKISLVEDGEGHVKVQMNGGDPDDGELVCEIQADLKGPLSPRRLGIESGAMNLEQLTAAFNYITIGDTEIRAIYNAYVQSGGQISLGDYIDDKGYNLDQHTIYIEEDAPPVQGASYLVRGLTQALANEEVVKAWVDSSDIEQEVKGAIANARARWEYTLREIQPILALYEAGIAFVLSSAGGVGGIVLDALFTFNDVMNGNFTGALPSVVGGAAGKIFGGKLVLQNIDGNAGNAITRQSIFSNAAEKEIVNTFIAFKKAAGAEDAAAEVARARYSTLVVIRSKLDAMAAAGDTAGVAALQEKLLHLYDDHVLPHSAIGGNRVYEMADGAWWNAQIALVTVGNIGAKPRWTFKKWVAHHWFPIKPELEREFIKRGVDPSEAGCWMLESEHRLMHSHKHPNNPGKRYEDLWSDFFREHENATATDIYAELNRLKQLFPVTAP